MTEVFLSPLLHRGVARMKEFCDTNQLKTPAVVRVPKDEWNFGSTCAYYRLDTIYICAEECAKPAVESWVRNWNWWGSVTDREPGGVICHELGHHVDLYMGEVKGSYYSEFSTEIMNATYEKPITSYHPNPAEWFAEMFRVYVTNAYLLKELRPKTFDILRDYFYPVSNKNWEKELEGCPPWVLNNLRKKVFL